MNVAFNKSTGYKVIYSVVIFSMLFYSVFQAGIPIHAQDGGSDPTVETPTEEVTPEVNSTEPAVPTDVPTEQPTELPPLPTDTPVISTDVPTDIPTLPTIEVSPTDESTTPTVEITPTSEPDVTAPTGSFISPAQAAVIETSPLTISVDAQDAESGVNRVEFNYAKEDPAVNLVNIGSVAAAPYSIDWDWSQVEDGVYYLYATIYDNAGNIFNPKPTGITLAHAVSFKSEEIDNDMISQAIEIPDPQSYGSYTSQNITNMTISSDEPTSVCSLGAAGTVWYKITALLGGKYYLATNGSSFPLSVSVFLQEGQSYKNIVCGEMDPTDQNTPVLGITMVKGKTYFIGIGSKSTSGQLIINLGRNSFCGLKWTCINVIGGDGRAVSNPSMSLYSTADNSFIETIYGDELGNISLENRLLSGKFNISVFGSGNVFEKSNYTISPVSVITLDEQLKKQILVQDQSGNPVSAYIELHSSSGSVSYLGKSPEDGSSLSFYAPEGIYSFFAYISSSKTILYKPGITVSSSGIVILDYSSVNQITLTINYTGYDQGRLLLYSPDDLSLWNIPIISGDILTIAAPDSSSMYTFFDGSLTNYNHEYKYSLSSGIIHLDEGDNQTLNLDDNFVISPFLSTGSPVNQDERVITSAFVTDGNNNRLIDYGSYFVSQFTPTTAIYNYPVNYPVYTRSNPIVDISIHDPANHIPTVTPMDDPIRLDSYYQFKLNENSDFIPGTWNVRYSTNIFPIGDLTANRDFEVSQGILNTNDLSTSPIVISSIPFSTSQNTIGATTSSTDPVNTACMGDKGFGSVWYGYTALDNTYITIDSGGTNYDTILAVWTGIPGNFKSIVCNDDVSISPLIQTSAVSFATKFNTTYYIEVVQKSFDTSSGQQIGGDLHLNIQSTPCYTLSTSFNITTGGTITASPTPNCSGTRYISGTQINITISPKPNYSFVKWSDNTSDNPYQVTMDGPKSIAAILEAIPGEPELLAPSDGAVVTDFTPTLDWNDSTPGADHFELQISTSQDFTTTIIDQNNLYGTIFGASTLSPNTTYYWRVRGLSYQGSIGQWSEINSFKTRLFIPILIYPESGGHALSIRPEFSWLSVPGATGYVIQISSTTSFTSSTTETGNVDTTSYITIKDYPRSVVRYWRVMANGINASNWSEVRSFNTANPPAIPTLKYPKDNSIWPFSQYSGPPTFQWIPLKGNVYNYEIQIAKSNTFSDLYMVSDEIIDAAFTGESDYFMYQANPILENNAYYYWRVRSLNTSGEYSGWSQILLLKTTLAAPELESLPTEINNLRPTFHWFPVEGATSYTITIFSGDDRNSTLIGSYQVASTSFTPSKDLPANIQGYWTVAGFGRVSGNDSLPSYFSTPNPPNTPSLISPSDNSLIYSYQPTLDWSDSSPNLEKYEFQIATNSSFTSNVQSVNPGTTSTITFSTPLSPNTKYFWHVRAFNPAEEFSSWSITRSFRTSLETPTQVGPSVGEKIHTLRPTLAWTAIIGAANYLVQISKNNRFSGKITNLTVSGASYTFPTDQSRGSTFYWRVKSNGSNPSDWSPAISYITPNPPGIPTLYSPKNKSLINTYLPTIDWSDSKPAALTYDLLLATDSGFTENLLTFSGLTGSYITLTNPLLANRTYFWKVRGLNADGDYGTWSSTWNFRTRMLPPVLTSPADAQHSLSTQPQLVWGSVSGASSYSVQVSLMNNFKSLLIKATTTTPSYIFTKDLTHNGTFYWRVMANGANPSNWSNVSSFIGGNPPSIPVLSTPVNKSITASFLPTFTWQVSTNSPATYDFQIATNSSFSTGLQEFDGLTGTTQTITDHLNPNLTYYWRVRSVKIGGEYSLWSSAWYIKTGSVPPSLTSPADASSVLSLQPNLSWSAVAGSTSYSIQIADSAIFDGAIVNLTSTSTSVSPTTDLAPLSTYFWRVSSTGNTVSAWSSPYSFTTPNPPGIPTLVSPANNAFPITLTPTLDWNDSTNSPDHYELQIATNSGFTANLQTIPSLIDTSYTIPTPLSNEFSYYWRVRSFNIGGEYSSWSGLNKFIYALRAPYLTYPSNGGKVKTSKPKMDFESVPGATGYQIQFSLYQSFSSILIEGTTGTPTAYQVKQALPKNKVIYWRMRTLNGSVPGPWSVVWSFTYKP
jgi:hypothetical protein